MDGGRPLVRLRALPDGEEVLVEATWADDDEDYDYWPPLFLPDRPESVFHGSFPKSRAMEYTEAAGAAIPLSTIVPGVVTEPFLGDRGDVRCQSRYGDGRWTVWMRRRLDTGSEFDAQIAPGGRYAFGCAAFDHAGKRHAYAPPTFHLVLED